MIRAVRQKRSGKIVVLTALLMTFMVVAMALVVDLGQLFVAESELQRTADSAALAAAWDLVDQGAVNGNSNRDNLEIDARNTAIQYAGLNHVASDAPSLAQEDVEIGYIADTSDPSAEIDTTSSFPPNAVRVRVRRTSSQNGVIPFFFARAFGNNGADRTAEATAVLINNFKGFKPPSNGDNIPFLPITCDKPSWDSLKTGAGSDNWTWNEETQQVSPGPDGIKEMNLYPIGSGSPGNRGMVDIGDSNNSTADVARQILNGPNAQDLSYHGGMIELDSYGELLLNADTGISAGIKDELAAIAGKPRIIPIFSSVSGNGNNANYTIIGFAGVCVMHVNLTGKMKSKQVIVQPCNVVFFGGIPAGSEAGNAQTTDYMYSPVWLKH